MAQPTRSSRRSGGSSHIGADPAAAPGPGVPITIVDSGTDPTHPDFAGRPNTTFLNDQTTFGADEFHGTMVASIAAAPENGVGIVGVYPTAALQLFDASPDGIGISNLAVTRRYRAASAHCPGVINLSFGSTSPRSANARRHPHTRCTTAASSLRPPATTAKTGSPPSYPASWPHVFTVAATDENDAVASFSTHLARESTLRRQVST